MDNSRKQTVRAPRSVDGSNWRPATRAWISKAAKPPKSRSVGTPPKAGGRQVSIDLVAGQPEKVIAETVERDGIDLLVMGAYGHSRIRSFFIGSTTAEMIRACKIPVFLFR